MQMEVSGNNNKKKCLKFMYVQTLLGHLNLTLKKHFCLFLFHFKVGRKMSARSERLCEFCASCESFKNAAVVFFLYI